MDWIDLALKVKTEDCETAQWVASEVAANGIYTEDYSNLEAETLEIAHIDLIDRALKQKDRSHVIVHVYLSAQDNLPSVMEQLDERLASLGVEHSFLTKNIKTEDWANNWKKYFHQLKIGKKILICPSWEEPVNDGEREVLLLEPGMAFGTGTHATTSLCMETAENYIKPGSTVLDIGCGSGIIALSALKLGAKSAVGVDIDEKAVKTARENAVRNGYGKDKAVFLEGDLTEKVTGKYNVVIANIVASVITELCSQVGDFMSDDGVFIVSGIIKESEAQVRKAFLLNRLKITEEHEKDGWLSFVLTKEERQ